MLRGHVFSEQIFGVDIFALFINQFLGGHNGIIESYKNAMEMTNTSNSITIKNGVAVIQGRYVEEHTETVLSYAKTDSLYCSLVIEIDLGKTNTKTSLEQVQYKILEGQNSYPTLTQNDIANQDGNIYQFELARFQNGAIGITNFTDRRTYLSFDSVYSGIIQDNLNSDSSTSALSAKQGKILGQYSTNETVVGSWIDGKPIYRKVINFGTLPNANSKSITTDLTWATTFVISISGFAIRSSDHIVLPINFTNPIDAREEIGCRLTGTNSIDVLTGTDRSNFTGYIILEYTKTTD